MESLIARVRNSLARATDLLRGRHVPIVKHAPAPEALEQRPLRSPPIDILENDDEVLIRADTPGAHPDNTWVYCDERGCLSLYVRRPAVPTAGPQYTQDIEGDWYRTLSLPEYVDGLAARATVTAGVMAVHAPKRRTSAPVLVPVKAS